MTEPLNPPADRQAAEAALAAALAATQLDDDDSLDRDENLWVEQQAIADSKAVLDYLLAHPDAARAVAAALVPDSLDVEELERAIRDFAATWHLANGHDGRVDDCGWSTCLGLLTGEIERGADLEARRVLEGETS